MRHLILLLVIGCTLVSCKPSSQTSTTPQGGKYYEDLSAYRPEVKEPAPTTEGKNQDDPKQKPVLTGDAQYAVNKQLNAVLDSIDRINLTRKFVDGFTIQIYSGLKKDEALNARKELVTNIPGITSELQYVQPNFRVKAGRYFSLLEAEKDVTAIKKLFPAAIVVPERIPIN